MEHHLVISAGGPWYDLLYNLAFLVALAILLYEGYKRKFPILKWILLLAISRISFIIGSKLATFSPAEWNYLFTHLTLPPTGKKSLFGGLILSAAGLFAGKFILRFRACFLDAFAIALPVALWIQRIGCLFAGCCYGKTTLLPWAVQYPTQSLAHYHQFQDGLLSFGDSLSMPVHPVQLYEVLLLVIAVLLIFRYRKRFLRTGSLMLLSMILILTSRFLTGFWRDSHAHTIGGEEIWIFNTTQLVILPVVITLILLLRHNESRAQRIMQYSMDSDLNLSAAIVLLFALSAFSLVISDWLEFPEFVAVSLTITAATGIVIYRLLLNYYLYPYKWLQLACLLIPLFLMAQTYPKNDENSEDSENFEKYKSIKIGYATGHFENLHNIGQGSGCDRVSETEYFDQKYSLIGAGYEISRIYQNPYEELSYGIKSWIGNHYQTRLSDQYRTKNALFGINPYTRLETNFFGIGGGINIGNLVIITENRHIDGTGHPETGFRKYNIYPQFYFRFGPRSVIYLDYRLADQFPSALPGFRHQFGIGTGLGYNNGLALRIGSNTDSIKYLAAKIPIKNSIVLEPVFLWGKSPQYESNKTFRQFSLGLSYRFGYHDGHGKRVGITP
jgi:prolipoprotein diacylglyceryltransferase